MKSASLFFLPQQDTATPLLSSTAFSVFFQTSHTLETLLIIYHESIWWLQLTGAWFAQLVCPFPSRLSKLTTLYLFLPRHSKHAERAPMFMNPHAHTGTQPSPKDHVQSRLYPKDCQILGLNIGDAFLLVYNTQETPFHLLWTSVSGPCLWLPAVTKQVPESRCHSHFLFHIIYSPVESLGWLVGLLGTVNTATASLLGHDFSFIRKT